MKRTLLSILLLTGIAYAQDSGDQWVPVLDPNQAFRGVVKVNSSNHFVPGTDNAVDLGSSSNEFRNLYIDGTATIDTLTVDESMTVTGVLEVSSQIFTSGNANGFSAQRSGGTKFWVNACDASKLCLGGTGSIAPTGGAMVIDGSGNIGINKFTPAAFLDIDGNVAVTSNVFINGNNVGYSAQVSGGTRLWMNACSSTKLCIGGTGSVAPGAGTIVTDGSNVGINNFSPIYALDVTGALQTSGQTIIGGSTTVKGSAFSVGGSTLSVAGGFVNAGSVFRVNTSTVPTYMDKGIVIYDDTPGVTGEVLQFRSSSVNHGLALAQIDTDVFGTFQANNSVTGGLVIGGVSESTESTRLLGTAIGTDTTKATNALAPVQLVGYSGNPNTGNSNPFGVDANLVSISNGGGSTVWIADSDGDTWQVGGSTLAGNKFYVGGSSLVVESGRVGVNTRTPTAILSVSGDIDTSSNVFINGNNIGYSAQRTGGTRFWFTACDVSKLCIGGTGAVAPGAGTIVTDGTNVGISNFSPAYPLDVTGDAQISAQAIVKGSMTVQGNAFSIGSATFSVVQGNVGIGDSTPDAVLEIAPKTGDSFSLRISSFNGTTDVLNVDAINNRVGILTASPAQTLDVTGTIQVSSTSYLGVISTASTSASNNSLQANCPAGRYAMGGGCKCTGNVTASCPNQNGAGSCIGSDLVPDGWHCECSSVGAMNAFAVCARIH